MFMNAEIIAIGSELLLGATVDTNSAYMARQLAAAGVGLFRKTVVGDNEERIADAIGEALARADLVICTGGLGPTVDDMTRASVARAFGVPLEFRDDLMAQVAARFQAMGRPMSDSNRTQAYVPQGARAIENPRGTAPAFLMEDARGSVICLPGVPHEMRWLFEHAVLPDLQHERGVSDIILVRTLHAVGLGESVIGERIADLMRLANPTVGISAKQAQYELRVSAKAASQAEAEALIAPVEAAIRERLGEALLGDEPLLAQVGRLLARKGATLALYEGQTHAPVYRALAANADVLAALRGVYIHPLDLPANAAAAASLAASGADAVRGRWRSTLALGVQSASSPDERGFTTVCVALAHDGGVAQQARAYDLTEPEAWEFVSTLALEALRQHLS
jgi:nicotinamide-nucleotide amidase